MRLIITEKNNSAKKIAEILSNGDYSEDASYKVPLYTWEGPEGESMTMGLKGHAVERAFPDEKIYKQWKLDTLHDLVDAPLVLRPTDGNVIRAVRKQAKGATSLIIATDFDREGELIGLETLEEALDVNPELGPTVRRARYSALTRDEIERAFSHLDDLSYPLANAGGARQDIDLYWGATLTRAVSLVSRAYGSNFLSVGRVQSPTLGLIVERELERRAHVAEPFWELFAKFAHPDGTFQAHHATDKFWDEAEAKAALEATTGTGTVESLTSRKNSSKPPTPYNTNSFQVDASSRLGITPKRAMSLAEDLYMDGFISYPRTDNTVYPESLPLKETIQALVKIDDFSQAAYLLDGPLQPTRGKKEDQAHPPIYPTQAVYPSALAEDKRRVYELVVRRFLATFAGPMISESTRADISIGGQTYFVRGKVVLDPGYAGIYHYSRSDDDEIPALEEGQKLELNGAPWLEEKETQPPPRLSQATLVQMKDEHGLGTQAPRADLIQKLYSRRYVRNNPPEPTATGMAMYEAFKQYVPGMATAEMTASLEAEMDRIAEGEMTKDEVVDDSRGLLHATIDEILNGEEELSKMIWAGMDRDRILGPCLACEEAGRTREDGSPNMLRIIRSKASGKSFVGCTGYDAEHKDDPKKSCDTSFPMPQPNFYEVTPLEERCSICGKTPRVNVKNRNSRRRPWQLCFNEDCPTMVEMGERKAEREAAQKAKKEMEAKEAASGNGAKPKKKVATASGNGASSNGKASGKNGAGGRKKAAAAAGARSGPPDPGTRRVRKAGSGRGSKGGGRKSAG
ncbi:MAG: DNA topoisomerase I [Solirubrobacterales bacterium]